MIMLIMVIIFSMIMSLKINYFELHGIQVIIFYDFEKTPIN